MATNSTNPLGFLFGAGNAEAKELATNIIKIRGGTILLGDKIINIRNIASVEVGSLAISFPWIAPLLILIGISVLQGGGFLPLIGLAVGGWGSFLIYIYFNRLNAKGLLILLNSGVNSSTLLTQIDIEFVKLIALTLYNIMSTGDERYLDIFVDQKTITEVRIEQVSNSVVSTGSVTGDLVNRVN